MRLIDFFDRGASFGKDRACLVEDARSLTYGEVQARTYRLANCLNSAGVHRGSLAAVLSPNDIDAFTCILAIWRSGATWMPLNFRSTFQENVAHMTAFRCEWLFYNSTLSNEVASIAGQLPALRGCICIDKDDGVHEPLSRWITSGDAGQPVVDWQFDDVAWLMLTGGTTGRSKGIMLTHGNLSTMVANMVSCMPYSEPPNYLVAAPMTHAAGCFATGVLPAGATFYFLPRPEPALVVDAIERRRINTLFLPPTVIYMLLNEPCIREHDYSSLKYFIYGAAPMSLEKLQQALDVFGPVMAEIYGQAESPAPCTFMSPEDHRRFISAAPNRLLSCGRPTIFSDIAILDDAGNVVEAGLHGEICIRGQHVMKGYFENPAATAEVSSHGWHHTGDVGYQDNDGYLFIVDRKKEMIISGGFNIFPNEIEQVILEHPCVQDCAVVGVPDDKWGEAVLAVLELRAGDTIDLEEIRLFCRHRLGGVKTPKAFEVWPELPRSAVGKISRRAIRDRFWQDQRRQV